MPRESGVPAPILWAVDECRRLAQAQRAAPDLDSARALTDQFLDRWPSVDGVQRSTTDVAGVTCYRFASRGSSAGVGRVAGPGARGRLLYVHGGGFSLGSAGRYAACLGRLSEASGLEAWACDYRLAPEHPFPAALDDVGAVLDALLRADDVGPVVVAGDSAGGGLAVAAVRRRVLMGRELPRALALFSPLLDLSASGQSYRSNNVKDVMLSARTVALIGRTYAAGEIGNPDVSPLAAESFAGFPPAAIYASTDEVLRDDSVMFAARLASDGVAVRLHLEPAAPHAWTLFGDGLPLARETLEDAAAYLVGQLT